MPVIVDDMDDGDSLIRQLGDALRPDQRVHIMDQSNIRSAGGNDASQITHGRTASKRTACFPNCLQTSDGIACWQDPDDIVTSRAKADPNEAHRYVLATHL